MNSLLTCVLLIACTSAYGAADNVFFMKQAAEPEMEREGVCGEFPSCQKENGQQSCCPFKNGICCANGKHCCPSGNRCNPESQKCEIDASLTKGDNNTCPDHKTHCESNQTCCKLRNGHYKCCQFPKATCCRDGYHCCPHGSRCDPKQKRCVHPHWSAFLSAELLDSPKDSSDHVPTDPISSAVDAKIVCPDHTTRCPDNTTCCQMTYGKFGCCPYPHGVCCADRQHCCPSGTRCTAQSTCEREATLTTGDDDTCPDHKTRCESNQTCCKQRNGRYKCCRFPKATCCLDGYHCCPHGSRCDPKQKKCVHPHWSAFLSAEPLETPKDFSVSMTRIPSAVGAKIVCPDHTSRCPEGSTCCRLATGKFGCCPYPHAVCCSDGYHCCPSGTTCDAKSQKCNRHDFSVPMLRKVAAEPIDLDNRRDSDTCPDQKTTCPSEYSTCCRTRSGAYACCPLVKATCCADGIHCCPHGRKCNTEKRTCEAGAVDMAVLSNLVQMSVWDNVICPDKQHSCPNKHTCCKLKTGEWGCCPYDKAACCPDGIHCCRHGFRCDSMHKRCVKDHLHSSMGQLMVKVVDGED